MDQGNQPVIDKNIPIPLYFQLEKWLLSEIKKGVYPPGSRIPTEIQLKDMFKVSRTTVRQAVNELIREGWLYRDSTKGTFAAVPEKKATSVKTMEPFNKQVIQSGQMPRTEVMELKIVNADDKIAGVLGIRPGDKVISMFRRRFADDVAVLTIRNYLAYDKCSFILEHDFISESLYDVLAEDSRTKTYGVRQIVEAQTPTMEDISLFKIKITTPILSFECVDSNKAGEAVTYNFLRYRGDCVQFEVDMEKGMANRSFCFENALAGKKAEVQ